MMKDLDYPTLERYLSAQRLETYLRLAQHDRAKAIELYQHNIERSQAFYATMHWLEVGLRNAMHQQLSQHYGEHWYDNAAAILSDKDAAQISKAKDNVTKDRKALTSGNIIAQLNFGFWVNLFNNPYESLWRHCLRRTFAHHPSKVERKDINRKLHPLLKLRNRIAHYEPIISYDLPALEQDMIDIIHWIEPNITL